MKISADWNKLNECNIGGRSEHSEPLAIDILEHQVKTTTAPNYHETKYKLLRLMVTQNSPITHTSFCLKAILKCTCFHTYTKPQRHHWYPHSLYDCCYPASLRGNVTLLPCTRTTLSSMTEILYITTNPSLPPVSLSVDMIERSCTGGNDRSKDVIHSDSDLYFPESDGLVPVPP